MNFAQLAQEPLDSWVKRLQTAGFPPHLVRAVVAAEIGREYRKRRAALFELHQTDEYWKRRMMMDPSLLAENRRLWQEQTDRIKQLLGEDPEGVDPMTAYFHRQRFGELPPGKADLVSRIADDYGDLRNRIFSDMNGIQLPEDREKLRFLEQEQLADLAKILNPAEIEAFELRSSPLAMNLRNRLAGFEVTEAEYRAIYQTMKQSDGSYSLGMMGQSPERMREQANAIAAAVSSTVSPERTNDLKQLFDPTYSSANRVALRLGLPLSAAREVVATQQETTTRAQQLRGDRSLTPEQRTAGLQTLAQEAASKVRGVFGDLGFDVYKTQGGFWLNNIVPPQATRSPTSPGATANSGTKGG